MEKITDTGRLNVRWATADEIAKARDSGEHVLTACQCGHVGLWMHKGLALNSNGGYNNARNIFYLSWGTHDECACSSSNLRMVVEE